MTNYFVSERFRMTGRHLLPQRTGGLALLMALAMLLTGPACAQESGGDDAGAKPAASKKLTGRLPNYFAAVVTPAQRQEVYKLQAGYASQLEKLQAQMDALIAERDQAVDEVLDAEQLAEVNQKREEARKRRAARRAPTAPETAPASEG